MIQKRAINSKYRSVNKKLIKDSWKNDSYGKESIVSMTIKDNMIFCCGRNNNGIKIWKINK